MIEVQMSELEESLKQIHTGRILDIATGRGGFIKSMTELLGGFDEIIGIDNKTENLKTAEKEFDDLRIKFIQMDAENLDFDSDSFDVVMISHSLHHVDKPDTVLEEMIRVLKPSGIFIIRELHRSDANEFQETQIEMHHWWADIDRQTGINHNHTFTYNELVDVLERLPLHDLKIAHCENPPPITDEDSLKQLDGKIENYISRVRDNKLEDHLIEKGAAIKRRISEIGIAWAPSILATAIK